MEERLPDFHIDFSGPVSASFLQKNITTFQHAASFIKALPYRRNTDKNNLLTVFSDNGGTCSTKHALLKRLADEHNFEDMELVLGIFKMNGRNTPQVKETLQQHGLGYIPEAHNYLKYKGAILDFTKSTPFDFVNDLLEETVILPGQITDYKVSLHKNYLHDWLRKNPELKFSLDELWRIREQCIADLGGK